MPRSFIAVRSDPCRREANCHSSYRRTTKLSCGAACLDVISRKAGMAAPSTSMAGSARPNTHRLLHQPAAPWVRHRNTLGGTPFLRDHVPLQLNDSKLSRTDPPNERVK